MIQADRQREELKFTQYLLSSGGYDFISGPFGPIPTSQSAIGTSIKSPTVSDLHEKPCAAHEAFVCTSLLSQRCISHCMRDNSGPVRGCAYL